MDTKLNPMAFAPGDIEGRFNGLIQRINAVFPLQPVALDPALAEPKSFLKILKARHYNWQAEGFRKVFGMRFTVRLPSLDQMNLILYPEADRDTPIFLMFCLMTGRKVICHVNVNAAFDDPEYTARWVAPLTAARERHGSFDCADRYPDWMLKWRTPAAIMGMFPKERFDAFMDCGLDYLDHYLRAAQAAAPVTDPARLARIRESQAQFVSDIRTQDKAQGMMAKMIGSATAHRIFHEITT
jgi:Ferredoxin-dependent bilin reductase